MNRLGLLERLGIHAFSTNYKYAGRKAKALFLALGLSIGLLCFPYSAVTTLLTGNSETVTITARKGVP